MPQSPEDYPEAMPVKYSNLMLTGFSWYDEVHCKGMHDSKIHELFYIRGSRSPEDRDEVISPEYSNFMLSHFLRLRL